MALFGRKSKKSKAPLTSAAQHDADVDNAEHYYAQPSYGHSQVGDLTFGDYATGVPNIRLSEMFASFGRQLKWVIPLFLLGTAGAWYLTKDFKRSYTGEGRIMVQLGEEYVYNPVTGNNSSANLLQTPDTITLNEVGIIKSSEVMDAVIGEMTESRGAVFNKSLFEKMAAARRRNDERAFQDAYMELRNFVDTSFYVAARPKTSLIDLSFKHEDPQMAVDTLNAFLRHYKLYRKTIFVDGTSDDISERRAEAEKQLKKNERAIAAYLNKNGISDFESEQKGLQKRTEDMKATLNALRAQIRETETALTVVEDQLRQSSPTINLYVDDRASQRIAQAELELKQLLAKYLPTSDPVRQKQTELAELRELMSSYNGKAAGGRRVGPNPVYQALVTQANTLKASADSFRDKEYILQQQLNSADRKTQRLTALTPQFQNLLRERETLSLRLKNYNSKEQEALLNQNQQADSSENIKVINDATYPIKGRNMRLLMFVLAALGWGFTLFMLALLKVFLDPKLYASPGPVMRQRISRPRYEDEQDDFIPEPVSPYVPNTPVPEYAPDEFQPAAAQSQGYQAPMQAGYAATAPAYAATEWTAEQAVGGATAQQYGAAEQQLQQPYYPSNGSVAMNPNYNPYAQAEQTERREEPPVFGPPPSH